MYAQRGIQTLQYYIARIQFILTRATANTVAAVIIWIVGALATNVALTELGVTGPTKAYAFILQGLLTICEGPIWNATLRVNRRGALLVGIGGLGIDLMLNVGGLWIYLSRLGDTTFWKAVMAATGQSNPPAPLTCFALACLLSLAVAAGPEALWDL